MTYLEFLEEHPGAARHMLNLNRSREQMRRGIAQRKEGLGEEAMTEKELKKLRREELLEMLIVQSKRAEELEQQLAQARAQLESRGIALEEAGSIAEAAFRLNGVYEAAQAAAQQYLENIQSLSARQQEISQRLETESRQAAEELLAETTARCKAMEEEARQKAESYWTEVSQRLDKYLADHAGLAELLSYQIPKPPGR